MEYKTVAKSRTFFGYFSVVFSRAFIWLLFWEGASKLSCKRNDIKMLQRDSKYIIQPLINNNGIFPLWMALEK